MNLLFGVVAIIAVGCLAVFLVALRREEQQAAPRNINIYIAQERRPGLHKVAARCCGPLTAIEGGRAAYPLAPAVRKKFSALRTAPLQGQPQFRKDELRQGSA